MGVFSEQRQASEFVDVGAPRRGARCVDAFLLESFGCEPHDGGGDQAFGGRVWSAFTGVADRLSWRLFVAFPKRLASRVECFADDRGDDCAGAAASSF